MAGSSITSTPGKPTFAANSANCGQGTRFVTSVLFYDKYIWWLDPAPNAFGKAGMAARD
jgi:hypothetical protein